MKALFVSPHCDDICLSIGGFAAAVEAPSVLVTVFSDSDWVDPSWSGEIPNGDVSSLREQEDRAYCARMGFERIALGLPDSGVRHAGQGDLRRASGDESRLVDGIAQALAAIVADVGADVVVAPLGVGGHADHVVCRRAAQRLHQTLALYEDLPYAWEIPLWRIGLAGRQLRARLSPLVFESVSTTIEKQHALRDYASQCNQVMFDAVEAHSARLRAHYDPRRASADATYERGVIERLWVDGDAEKVAALCGPGCRVLSPRSLLSQATIA